MFIGQLKGNDSVNKAVFRLIHKTTAKQGCFTLS